MPNRVDSTTAFDSSADLSAGPCRPQGPQVDTPAVLVVDDDVSVTRALERCFRLADLKAITTNDPDEALNIISRHHVGVIISDFKMPGIDGIELLGRIRGLHPQIIRILLTGNADREDISPAIEQQIIFKFLTKPWDDDDLLLTIQAAMSQYALMSEQAELTAICRRQRSELTRMHRAASASSSLIQRLAKTKDITPAQRQMVSQYAIEAQISMVHALVDLGLADEGRIVRTLQDLSGLDCIELDDDKLDKDLATLMPADLCRQTSSVPVVGSTADRLVLAMADPIDLGAVDQIRFQLNCRISTRLACLSDIERAIDYLYGTSDPVAAEDNLPEPVNERQDSGSGVGEDQLVLAGRSVPAPASLLSGGRQSSAVNLVDAIVAEALNLGASDVHIEPKPQTTLVRYRVDGILRGGPAVPARYHLSLVSRIKVLARMDISIRRVPQDGRISVRSDRGLLDVRVSSLPTLNGEKIVMRMLDKTGSLRRVEELGLSESAHGALMRLIDVPQGVIIATGPTGSGKTTTLYALLNYRINSEINCITLEDPVEYVLDDASQVHVHDKAGLTFAASLRSSLRQDPDTILLGEIRDNETAMAAFQAAMTGHLVFSTLHTNSAAATVTRLVNLGIPPYMVASGVQGVIAQRLVRRICSDCREEVAPDHDLMLKLGFDENEMPARVWRGRGCASCDGQGYKGRLGIYEILVMDEDFHNLITTTNNESELVRSARAAGMRSLRDEGMDRIREGLTSPEELLRVIGPSVRANCLCDKCGRTLRSSFNVCPWCGYERHTTCRKCMSVLERGWVACPYCGHTLALSRDGASGQR